MTGEICIGIYFDETFPNFDPLTEGFEFRVVKSYSGAKSTATSASKLHIRYAFAMHIGVNVWSRNGNVNLLPMQDTYRVFLSDRDLVRRRQS